MRLDWFASWGDTRRIAYLRASTLCCGGFMPGLLRNRLPCEVNSLPSRGELSRLCWAPKVAGSFYERAVPQRDGCGIGRHHSCFPLTLCSGYVAKKKDLLRKVWNPIENPYEIVWKVAQISSAHA